MPRKATAAFAATVRGTITVAGYGAAGSASSGSAAASSPTVVRAPAAVLAAFTTSPPCQRKGNHPPGDAARAEAARLLAGLGGGEVTVDLHRYAELAEAAGR